MALQRAIGGALLSILGMFAGAVGWLPPVCFEEDAWIFVCIEQERTEETEILRSVFAILPSLCSLLFIFRL